MDTYSVKQIAEMLNTNPETVRRWIRSKKLRAVQISRKDGNIITEDELQRFLKNTPKYLPKVPRSVAIAMPAMNIAALAGAFATSAIMEYLNRKNDIDVRVQPEDLKNYLEECIPKYENQILQKKALISQTEEEILALEKQVEQHKYLIEHDELISKLVAETADIKTNKEE